MKMETAQKRLAYQESVWAVKELDLIEENRKMHLRIGKGNALDETLTHSHFRGGSRYFGKGSGGNVNKDKTGTGSTQRSIPSDLRIILRRSKHR